MNLLQRFLNFIRALRLLGAFAFILALSILIITLSIYNMFTIGQGLEKVHDLSTLRFVLEEYEFALLEQELAERSLLSTGNSAAAQHRFNTAAARLDELEAEMAEHGDEHEAELAAIRQLRAETVEHFTHTVAELDGRAAHQIDDEERAAFLEELFAEESEIGQLLEDMIFAAEIAVGEQAEAVNRQNERAIVVGVLGLILFPLLSIWAFLVASRITRPLLQFINLLAAVEGQKVRPSDGNRIARGGLGRLEQALTQTAAALAEQETQAERELADLRRQLSQTRQRKLMTGPLRRPSDDEFLDEELLV